MTFKSWAVLESLLRSHHENNIELFSKFLPEEALQNFSNLPVDTAVHSNLLSSAEESLSSMHYSWLLGAVKKIPSEAYNFYLSALPEIQAEVISTALNKNIDKVNLSRFGQAYLLHYFQQNFLDEKEILPVQCLPISDFHSLLKMEKRRLIQLMGYLGLWDLAIRLKELNHGGLSQSVEKVLSFKKKEYLNICLQEDDIVSLSTIEIEKWDGDKRNLEYMLHQRGVERLGYALSGQHKGFIWHLCHKLDTGRATVLLKYHSEEQLPESPVLTSRLLNLVEFLG
ncbi:MAG: hypothetical protein ACI9S8_000579 [Chlamydiales bacterium]